MDCYSNLRTQKKKVSAFYRFTSAGLILALSFTQILPNSFAQSISPLNLPVPGTMVTMSEAFVPVLLKGMTLNPKDPFHIDFIVDSGNTRFASDDIRKESDRLVKYFMASMTVPKNDLWVDLSPYEKDRIIPNELGKTELGRDLLAQDYMLKQLSSSLMYPDSELGAKFWEKVYRQAQEKYGVTDIPLNTFNKVWILPESATVYEHANSVYITESHLKVMMDEDYLNSDTGYVVSGTKNKERSTYHVALTTQIMKEIILPAIEREVNMGKNFAPLRQIYHSLILAKWYKETVKQSILSQVYVDQNKVSGLELNDPTAKEKIYDQYMEAYKKGVYNYMKEEYDQLSQSVIPRQYFSGGFSDSAMLIKRTDAAKVADGKVGNDFVVGVDVRAENETSLTRRQFLKAAGVVVAASLVGGISPSMSQADDQVNSLVEELDQQGIFMYRNTRSWHEGFVINTINILGNKGGNNAVEALIKLLKDENNNVRYAAVKALNKLQVSKEQLLKGYIEVLKVNTYYPRYDAVKALGNSGDSRAVEPLIEELSGRLPSDLAVVVIEALGKLGDNRALDVLFKKLRLKDENVQQALKEVFVKLHVNKDLVVDAYIAVFKDGYLDGMPNAAEMLGELGDKRAVDILILNLYHHNSDIREAVRQALMKLGVDPGKVFLRKLWLEHPYFISVVGTAGGVGLIGYTAYQLWSRYTVRGNVYKLTNGELEYYYRERAEKFLARNESPRVVELLFEQLEAGFSFTQPIEKLLNNKLESYSFEELQKLMRFKNWKARVIIMRALGKLQDERADDLIVDGVNDESGDVRLVAVEVLSKTKTSQKFELFLRRLTDTNNKVRKLSIDVLGDMKNSQANDALIIRLSDSIEVQDAARSALEKINGPSFISNLEQSNDPRKIYVLLGLLRRVTQAENRQDLI